jgi:nucleotide-binding universal stress UspA family protein
VGYGTVVVGTDGSPTASRAVRQASQLAADHGARLVVVTAYEPQGDALVDTAGAPKELQWMLTDKVQAEELAGSGRAVAKEAGVERVSVQAVAGSPGDVLLEAAVDHGADCIVVGSVGLTSPARFVLGSVASAVAHHAPCDVLVVHTTDSEGTS